MPAKSVLITGAAGFIGSHLVERCLDLGWHVVALDALTEYYDVAVKRRNLMAAAEHTNCVVVQGDLCEVDLAAILADVEIVFHLAAQPGVRASWDDFPLYNRLNVLATQRLLHAAQQHRLERVVVASSSSVYGNAESMPTSEDASLRPVSPYGVTKVSTEQLAHVYWRSFDVPTVCMRYFTVYGPRQRPDMAFHRLIAQVLAGEPFEVYGDGKQTRDFTFVSDAVAGTVAAAQRGQPGSIYNIGGGAQRSMDDVFDTLARLTGQPVDRNYVGARAGDARDTAADITRAWRDLDFEPAVEFDTGLSEQLEWQRAALASLQPQS